MNLIVLAAGRGNRMGVMTKDKPKILLNLEGLTLLERQHKSITECSVFDRVIYVLGYMAEAIEEKLAKLNFSDVVTVFNPFYEISNNLISLWFAKYYMDTDFAITNGDNLFQSSILREMSFNRDGIYLAVNKKEKYDNDDMKIIVDDGNIIKVSKLIGENDANYESVGLAVISGKKYRELFKNTIEKAARSKDYQDKFWLEVFNLMAKENVPIKPYQIKGKWQEFDYHRDIENFNGMIENNNPGAL
jgi:L-glutamine-phosphate cytidylyltransferase